MKKKWEYITFQSYYQVTEFLATLTEEQVKLAKVTDGTRIVVFYPQ